MNKLKELFRGTGLMLLGTIAIIMLVVMLLWEGLKAVGSVVAWTVSAKLDERKAKQNEKLVR